MSQSWLQSRQSLLWALSIAASLLLQLLLINLVWKTCTTYDEQPRPEQLAITVNPVQATAHIEEIQSVSAPAVREPEAVTIPIQEPVVSVQPVQPVQPVKLEQEPAPEPAPEPTPEPKPEPKPEPAAIRIPEPIKPAPVKAKPVKKKSRPITTTPAKKAVPPPVRPLPAIQPKPMPAEVPAPELPMTPVKSAATTAVQPSAKVITTNQAPSAAAAASTGEKAAAEPTVPLKNFNSYLQKIFRIIERNKRYPANAKRRGIKGKVQVSFTINSAGRVCNATAARDVAPELREAALQLLADQRFPAPPDDWSENARIELAINYSLR